MHLTRSLQWRLLLGAAAWGLLALAVTGVLLFYLVREQLEAQLEQQLAADLNQLLAHIEADASGWPTLHGQLSDPLYQRVFSGAYWQIARNGRTLRRSRSLWDQNLPATAPAGTGYRHANGPRGQALLVFHRPVTVPHIDGTLQLQVATDLRTVNATLRRSVLILATGLGTLALALVLAAFLQVRLGLRPLRRLRAGLAHIRAGGAERLEGDYPAEIRPLVADLNTVLTDNQNLIERARNQAGNLAHALKTPLSVLTNEADAQIRQGNAALGERLLRETRNMQHDIEWHLTHARIAAARGPAARTRVTPVLERLRRTLARLYRERVIVADAPAAAIFRGEARDLEQMLGNLMDNACKWATTQVRVTVAIDGDTLHVTVNDDGLGLAPEARLQALQRGSRLDENTPGDGLGLAIVRDLAELYGGRLRLDAAAEGGLCARLTLPAASA